MIEIYLAFIGEVIKNREIAILAMLGGIFPALLWLWFWLKEDKRSPEPKIRIAVTFIFGMVVGLIVIPIQYFIEAAFFSAIIIVFLAAFAEEFFKYFAAYFTALRTKVADEPVDIIIYMITAALGFSAFENALYLLSPLFDGNLIDSFTLTNFRFIGASLLHTAASGILGISIAFSFYKPAGYKKLSLMIGLILATGLHALFNLLIMKGELLAMFSILTAVWIIIVVILLFFEKVKTIKN